MSAKIDRIITALKENGWHGELEEDETVTHISGERGKELVDIWLDGDRLMYPAEYVYDGVTVAEKTTAGIRQRIEAPPGLDAAQAIRRDRSVTFTADDDDATILDGLMGKTVYCHSLIADDFPQTTHRVLFDRLTPAKVDRLEDGLVNVDYVDETGFHSLRVNNIVKVKA